MSTDAAIPAGPHRSDLGTQAPVSPSELAAGLRALLLLETAPVGVRLVRSASEFDSCTFPTPHRPTKYCAAVRRASEGATLKLAADDVDCQAATRTLGLETGLLDPDFVGSYVETGLYNDETRAGEVLADVAALDGIVGVAVGPLEAFDASAPPDVVVVPTLPYGAMRIAQAVGVAGKRVRGVTIGMHGICSESTAAPAATGEVCASFLCSGSRHAGGWDEQHLSTGIPFGSLPDVIDGLALTAQRYETDERKAEIRTSHGTAGGSMSRPYKVVPALTDRGGYFYE
jgi:uncharacterized protein (DUF169 family)